jgi:hypothetical protein
MKSLAVIFVWFAAVLSVHGQGPRMTVAGTQTILEIEEASVKVQVTGSVVSTEMELMFRNPTARMVEGEFVLPLPAGATVSNYALEVNGALREAVAVEKERARVAYETIKRQMIDPGIVEREAGNVYRTRVFPVPASGTKRLRIGYVETLRQEAGGFRYRVPLKFEGLLKEFRCEIAGAGSGELVLDGEAPLAFETDPANGKRSCLAKAVRMAGELELKLPLPAGPELVVEDGKTPVFLLSDVFPPMQEVKRPPVRSVLLFWDASESGAGRDHEPTFRLLDAWFREQGEVKVVLKFLRDGIEEGGMHEVRGGDWGAVRRLLETVDYDGATSLEGLAVGAQEADLAIYCGDGVATLGRTTGLIERPLMVLKRGAGELAGSLGEWMDRSGGIEVEVDRMETAAALRKMLVLPFRVVGVSGEGVGDFQVEAGELRPGQALRVSGSLNAAGAVEISYGVGTEVKLRRKAAFWEVRQDAGVLRRLWAQRKLLEMERGPERDAWKITAHCIEHGLVSDETSLIVLERFEDHVRYEIPPPEADLRVKYDEAMEQKRQGVAGSLESRWRSRLAWYERSFPDRDYVLRPRLKQVAIWKRSVEKVFAPEELDAVAFGKVAGWHERVLALIERRRTLPDAKAYEAWVKEVEALDDEGSKLAATPVAAPPPGKPLVVSVRGLVVEPGQVRSDGPLTLREAVAKAGGRLLGGELGPVALYRNAGKTVYSTASRQFTDVDLKPGDLLVVEDDWYGSDGGDDPFAEAVESDPGDGPAVIRSEDVWIGEGSSDGSIGAGGGQERRAAAGAIRVVDPAEAGMPDLAGFEAALKAGGDPVKAYLELKGGQLRPLRFYVEAARRLFAAGQDGVAMRVLSTIVERGEGSGASRRALAFWSMEFGKPAEAERVLKSIGVEKGGCPVSFARAELAKDRDRAAGLFMEGAIDGAIEEIGLSEVNGMAPEWLPVLEAYAEDLSSDLRITVLSQFPDQVPEMEIVEATGEPLSQGVSPTGGRLTVGEGVAEYMIRRAVPGTYAVRISCKTDTTFRIAVHSNWGRENQKTLRMTRLVDGVGKETVAEVEFEFAAGQ